MMSILSKTFGILAISAVSIPSLAAAEPLYPERNLDFLEDRYGNTLGNTRSPSCVDPSTHNEDGLLAYDIGRDTAIVLQDKDTIGVRITLQNNKGRPTCDASK